MNLTIEESKKLVDWGFIFIGFILPIIIFGILRRCFPRRASGEHEKVAILIVWLSMLRYSTWTTPIRIAYSESLESPGSWSQGMHDGTGVNSFVVVVGWMIPLISLLIFSGITALVRYIRALTKTRHPNKIA